MNTLIIGKSGQLAQELQALQPIEVIAWGRNEVNLLDEKDLLKKVQTLKPNYIVNASAYTAVDKAESEGREAYKINCEGVKNLGLISRTLNIPIIHISTDFVFDGNSTTPYRESDDTNPIGIYGKSKRDGELALVEANPNAIIIRTSWLYGNFGQNFYKTMIRLAQDRVEIGVVNDQFGSPTSTLDLAKAIFHTMEHKRWIPGIYHYSNQGIATWYEFAKEIFDQTSIAIKVNPITTAEYPTPASRPKFSKLDSSKWQQTFGQSIPHWKTSLTEVLKAHEF
jgi:dTDP-4-dehydrorhamnose reductase